MRVRIAAEAIGEVTVELLTDYNPKTVEAIWAALPIQGRANTWGEEIYFAVDIGADRENGQQVVEKGDVAYWPPGDALCIFFGPTPASRGDEIRAASPVNVFGRVHGDPAVFGGVQQGDVLTVSKDE
jgi:hypothetical protein